MALKIRFTVGADTFEAEGDFAFDEGLLAIVQAWSRSIGQAPEQRDVDALAAKSEAQSAELEAAVQAHQPTSPGA